MSSANIHVLRGAVIGLTLVSVSAGFEFYHNLFGLATAILCCVIFETIRLGCLWAWLFSGRARQLIALPIYLMVAFTCATAGITSFHARIIERQSEKLEPLEQAMAERIRLIQRTYALKVADKLRAVEEKIDFSRRKLAWNPKSSYWNNRLAQLIAQRLETVTERDRFLSATPEENREQWIARNASMLDLDLKPIDSALHCATAYTKAIQELWRVSELQAKNTVSIIIVICVECGIVMLSLLARPGPNKKQTIPANRLLRELLGRFNKVQIRKFVEKSEVSLREQGRLPLTKELSQKQREIKRALLTADPAGTELQELARQLQTQGTSSTRDQDSLEGRSEEL
jgi:hypothetical protein